MKDFLDSKFWENLSSLYNKTKEYLLLIEEFEAEHSTILQPIKEQRDALDHIVRAYSAKNDKELKEHFEKATGHLERALNDCADILSIVLRRKISDYLTSFSYEQIVSIWGDYPIKRVFLLKVDEEIAKIRNRDNTSNKDSVEQYDAIINKLKEIYYHIAIELYPKLIKFK